ncbi:hypothetical protein [Geminocystis sp. GBBB08]|uniref:hypothetical protein n=1 Tax=Geminocystis sp. GBBB08 TaxID=2604140 RepID=UPI0027E238FB|nr:hypothetical protein [Geminocystis sp. GBBB08]MBL1209815.1 hypothetical protein [Geminocystis sp. GBBB08]
MAIYNFNINDNSITPLEKTNFSSEKILERQNLQKAIKDKIDIIAPNCLVISEEFSQWDDSKRRIEKLGYEIKRN